MALQNGFKLPPAAKDILAGTMGGIAQTLAGHPLDTVKVRLATQVRIAGQKPMYNGMVDCLTKTFKEEGVRGLYKGSASPLVGAMFHNACLFFANGQARRLMGGNDSSSLPLLSEFYCGMIAGGAVCVVETPIDLLKIKLQSQVGKGGQYKNVFHAASSIYGGYGFRGLYKGFVPTVMRNIPAFGGYFFTFEAVKRWLTKPGDKEPSLTACFLAGGAGGFGFWGFIYPIELIKTRLQNDSLNPAQQQYKGIWDCFRQTLKSEGIRGFFRGYLPANVRAVPVNAFVFLAVTASKRAMNERENKK